LSDLVLLDAEIEGVAASCSPPFLGPREQVSTICSSPYPVTGNCKSHIYHRPDCPNYSRIDLRTSEQTKPKSSTQGKPASTAGFQCIDNLLEEKVRQASKTAALPLNYTDLIYQSTNPSRYSRRKTLQLRLKLSRELVAPRVCHAPTNAETSTIRNRQGNHASIVQKRSNGETTYSLPGCEKGRGTAG
jgi:hypothetical protein